jgi:mono/diheme cytochrome c family protein
MLTFSARLLLAATLLVIVGAVLASCASEATKPDQSVLLQDPKYIMGSGLYKRNCAGCHGDRGEGHTSLGPAINTQKWQQSITDEQIRKVILEGRRVAGTSMDSFQGMLTDDEVAAVIVYVRSLHE